MVEAMMEKLNEKKAPLDILEEGIASIEADLGRNEGLRKQGKVTASSRLRPVFRKEPSINFYSQLAS